MAKENNSRDNDSAFIADLLSKLRQQMEMPPVEEPITPPTDESAEVSFTPAVSAPSIEVPPAVEDTPPAAVASATDISNAVAATTASIPSVASAPSSVPDPVGMQFSMDIPSSAPVAEPVPSYTRPTPVNRVPVTPVVEDIPVTEPEQLALSFEEEAPAVELPVPDEVPEEIASFNMPEPSVAPAPVNEPGSDIPASIWDFPRSTMEAPAYTDAFSHMFVPTPVSEPVPQVVPDLSLEDDENVSFHATVRAPRHTLADVDFDATANDGHYCDKLLQEPLESLGGEHAEAQVEQWKQELSTKKRFGHIGLIIATVLLGLLMLFELAYPLRDWFLGILMLTRIPGVVQLIDMQLLILICLIGHRPIYRGIASLRFGRVMPETLASFAAVASLIASIVFYFVDDFGDHLFGLCGGFVVFAAVFADYCRVRALNCAYRAYCATGKRYVGLLSDARDHARLGELFREASAPVNLMEIEPASAVDDFVVSSRTRVEEQRSPLVSLIVAGGVALVDLIVLLILSVLSWKEGLDISFAFWSASVVFITVLPLSIFVTHRFFHWVLSARIAKERIGVTGEDAIYRYADTSVMTFEDTEAFPNGSVRVNGIKLCGDFALDKALYLVSSVFDRIGGPLNGVFKISTADVRISDDVVIRRLAKEGIDAQVNHEDVCVGTRAHLEGVGIEVFHDIEDERAEGDGNRVLYVAYRGFLVVKFYVKYEISTTFEKNVEYYAKQGISSVIITADPLLNAEVLDSISYISDYDVRFNKRDLASYEETEETSHSADMITYGPRKTLRRMPFFFKKYIARQRIASIISMVGVALTGVLAPVLLAAFVSKSVLWAFLCQLLCVTPGVVLALFLKRLNPNP